jgi:predicted TIM-barrel fold metal-dependent hydrolase
VNIVDAHRHLWDLSQNQHPWLCNEPRIPFRYGDYEPICNSYLPEDYDQDSVGYTVVGSVHVEAEWDSTNPVAETRWLDTIAPDCHHTLVIVAQAQLDREDIVDVLRGHAASPNVRGVRHKPAVSTTPYNAKRGGAGSMDDPIWRDGFSRLSSYGFSFDLQVPFWHLNQAAELARDFPKTTIILNHAGLPGDRDRESLTPWQKALELLALEPNTAVKISGLGLPGQPWTLASNRNVVKDTISMFGMNRCMFASNFPVDRLCATFNDIYHGFEEIVSEYSQEHRDKLFRSNAVDYYRMRV